MTNEQQPILSEEEKEHIRAEMRFREELRRELKPVEPSANQKPSWIARAIEYLSKPIFTTIIFGALISFGMWYVQHKAAREENERTYLLSLRERKFQLLGSFDANFNNSFSSRLHYAQKLNWVNSYKDPKAFPGGRAEYYKAQDDLEAKWKALSALPTYTGLCAQVDSLYESTKVHDSAQALREAAEESRMLPVASETDIYTILGRVGPKVEALLVAMGEEIKKPPQQQ
ncbi:MAG: hypothetical protein LC802_08060 [Acidobacteria bacterium]|nr:hypothetical protein [Acidobacteriota bacterium]